MFYNQWQAKIQLVNVSHKELKHFWKQKGIQPNTNKVYLIKWAVSECHVSKYRQTHKHKHTHVFGGQTSSESSACTRHAYVHVLMFFSIGFPSGSSVSHVTRGSFQHRPPCPFKVSLQFLKNFEALSQYSNLWRTLSLDQHTHPSVSYHWEHNCSWGNVRCCQTCYIYTQRNEWCHCWTCEAPRNVSV